MSKENAKTLEVYEEKASTYLATTIEHDNLNPAKAKAKQEKVESFIKNSIKTIPNGAKVFEIGSGDGTNAKYIESLGYEVTASDVSDAFINATKSKGLNTVKFNVLEDKFQEKYFAVLCWRVFVHFTIEDAKEVLKRVYETLEDGGVFIFNAMNREIREVDEEWVDFSNEYHMGVDRYYKYYNEEELNNIIFKTGYKISDFHKEGGDNNNKWLVYVLRK